MTYVTPFPGTHNYSIWTNTDGTLILVARLDHLQDHIHTLPANWTKP